MRKAIAAAVGCVLSIFSICPAEEPPREPLTDIVQLTSGFARAGEAYFSPDAKWIIFQASPPGEPHYQMYVAELIWKDQKIAGLGQPFRISPEKSRNTCGFFSPDGKTIIFGSTAGKEKPDEASGGYQREGRNYRWAFPTGMEIFRADDWQRSINSLDSGDRVNLARKPLTSNEVYDAECAFSPDGKWICFASGAGADADIYVMKADGSGKVRITNAKGYDGGPFFSPDGKRLLYRSDRKGNDLLQVFTCELILDEKSNITGSKDEKQLTDDANVNWGPTWHPSGKHITYATSAHGHANYEIYRMREDGSEKTRLTHKDGADVLPVFSPDGKWLMWTSKRSTDGTTQVFAARVQLPSR